jgi:hypothetical protein
LSKKPAKFSLAQAMNFGHSEYPVDFSLQFAGLDKPHHG